MDLDSGLGVLVNVSHAHFSSYFIEMKGSRSKRDHNWLRMNRLYSRIVLDGKVLSANQQQRGSAAISASILNLAIRAASRFCRPGWNGDT